MPKKKKKSKVKKKSFKRVNKKTKVRKVSKKIKKAYIIGKNTSFFSKQIKRSIPYVISRNISNAITHILLDIKKNKNIKNTLQSFINAVTIVHINYFYYYDS